jgi:hypothetical protein
MPDFDKIHELASRMADLTIRLSKFEDAARQLISGESEKGILVLMELIGQPKTLTDVPGAIAYTGILDYWRDLARGIRDKANASANGRLERIEGKLDELLPECRERTGTYRDMLSTLNRLIAEVQESRRRATL